MMDDILGKCERCMYYDMKSEEEPCVGCCRRYLDHYKIKRINNKDMINALKQINPRTMNARDWQLLCDIVEELELREKENEEGFYDKTENLYY